MAVDSSSSQSAFDRGQDSTGQYNLSPFTRTTEYEVVTWHGNSKTQCLLPCSVMPKILGNEFGISSNSSICLGSRKDHYIFWITVKSLFSHQPHSALFSLHYEVCHCSCFLFTVVAVDSGTSRSLSETAKGSGWTFQSSPMISVASHTISYVIWREWTLPPSTWGHTMKIPKRRGEAKMPVVIRRDS